MMATQPKLLVMGVSGCGKSRVGSLLAQALAVPFFDADDYHSRANVEKMASGIPLTDDDRAGWQLVVWSLRQIDKGRGISQIVPDCDIAWFQCNDT